MEALQIIIPAVTGILGLFIGYFLNQAIYERKRRDELADREFSRRAKIHDMRIQEAREVAEKFSTIISLMKEMARVFEEEDDLEEAYHLLQFHEDEFSKIPVMMNEALRHRTSIDLLNDAELIDLREELFDRLILPFQQMMSMEKNAPAVKERFKKISKDLHEIRERTKEGENIIEDEILDYVDIRIDVKDVTKGVDLEEVQNHFGEAEKVITKIKSRLDKLAQKIP